MGLDRLTITALCEGPVLSYVQYSQALYEAGYTGPTVVHWLHGRPRMIEFPRERKQIVLDAGPEVPHASRVF